MVKTFEDDIRSNYQAGISQGNIVYNFLNDGIIEENFNISPTIGIIEGNYKAIVGDYNVLKCRIN